MTRAPASISPLRTMTLRLPSATRMSPRRSTSTLLMRESSRTIDPIETVERFVGEGHGSAHRGQAQRELHALIQREQACPLRYPEQRIGTPGSARHPARQPVEARLDRAVVDPGASLELEAPFQTLADHRDPGGGDLGADFQHAGVVEIDEPVTGPYAVAGRYQHLGDAPREGRPHYGAVQVDAGLLGARPCPGETGFQLPAPTVVLRDRELAPVHRQRLAGLLLSCDVVAGQRADIRLDEVLGPLGGLAHEREKLELVTCRALLSLWWRWCSCASSASSSWTSELRSARTRCASRASRATRRWPASAHSPSSTSTATTSAESAAESRARRGASTRPKRERSGARAAGRTSSTATTHTFSSSESGGRCGVLFTSMTVPPTPASRIRSGSAMRKNLRTFPRRGRVDKEDGSSPDRRFRRRGRATRLPLPCPGRPHGAGHRSGRRRFRQGYAMPPVRSRGRVSRLAAAKDFRPAAAGPDSFRRSRRAG